MSSGSGTAARTRAAVLAYLDALNTGDPDRIAAAVTEDFDNEHTSARGVRVRGRAAYRERLPGFLAAFAGLHYELEDLLVDGDRAAVAYRMTGRMHAAPMLAAHAPLGGDPRVLITVRGMFRFRVRDGLIAHRVDYWDGEQVAAQLAAATRAVTPPR
jgi:predicted ester cyclase